MHLKLFKISLILLISFSLFSCDKDDKTQNKTVNELIVGKWQLEKIYDLNGNDVSDECTEMNIMEFFPDNTMEWFSYEKHAGNCAEYFYHLSNNVTYNIAGNSLVIHIKSLDGTAENELEYPDFDVSETQLIIRVATEHKGAFYKRIP